MDAARFTKEDYEKVYLRVFKTVVELHQELIFLDPTGKLPKAPGWVTRLSNYFTDGSVIDSIVELTGEDPLNRRGFVSLRINFVRPVDLPVDNVAKTEERTIELT